MLIYIVYKNQPQQIIAVICAIVAIVGIRQINDIILILKEKIREAKNLDFPWLGRLEGADTKSDKPEELKRIEIISPETAFSMIFAAGKNYVRENNLPQAVRYFENALKIKPDDVELHIILAYIYGEGIRDKQKAIFYCERALKIDPNSISAQFNLAVYTNHLKGYKQSRPLYEKAEKLILEQKATKSELYGKLNLFLGHDLRDGGDNKGAEERYNKAIALLKTLTDKGDKTAAFWLKNAEENLKALQHT